MSEPNQFRVADTFGGPVDTDYGPVPGCVRGTCPHARMAHDVWDDGDPMPRCGAPGCDCGEVTAAIVREFPAYYLDGPGREFLTDAILQEVQNSAPQGVSHCPQVEPAQDLPVRPFRDLMEPTGLLWLINRTVFHPRGFALALVFADDDRQQPVGWQLVGNGTQVWTYDPAETANEADRFQAVTTLFDRLRLQAFEQQDEQAAGEMQAAIDELVSLGLVEVVDDADHDADTTTDR